MSFLPSLTTKQQHRKLAIAQQGSIEINITLEQVLILPSYQKYEERNCHANLKLNSATMHSFLKPFNLKLTSIIGLVTSLWCVHFINIW